MEPSYYCVFCTCSSFEEGQRLARRIVEDKLAACANILPGLTSIYSWNGQLETNSEVLLILKTTAEAYSELETALAHIHPYECPEIIGIPIEYGYKGYLEWINNTVLTKQPS